MAGATGQRPAVAPRIGLIVDRDNPAAREAEAALRERYALVDERDADVGVVVGGDGFMLRTLHRLLEERRELPVYGLNLGTVGFLLNQHAVDGLPERVREAEATVLHPLRMEARTVDDTVSVHLAVNEVSLLRASAQSAQLRISVDGRSEVEDLAGDGVLVATPAGSTAYNRSAGGPIVPLAARLLAVTPVAAHRPRGWRGALLGADTTVQLDIVHGDRRPVLATADHHDVGPVRSVTVRQDDDVQLVLLFDPDHTLETRILREQFR